MGTIDAPKNEQLYDSVVWYSSNDGIQKDIQKTDEQMEESPRLFRQQLK